MKNDNEKVTIPKEEKVKEKKVKVKKEKNKKREKKVVEKKNLSIVNQGDFIIIRNRSAIAASVLSVIILGVCAAGVYTLRQAWDLPLFWTAFGLLVLGIIYSLAKTVFSKIVLNSPQKTITVYNPFPIQYKFEDVNYIDRKTVKDRTAPDAHVVIAYIGEGKKNVSITSYSKAQANELAILLNGMLDNGAMIFPEYEEDPLDYGGKMQKHDFITSKKNGKMRKFEPHNEWGADTRDSTDTAAEKKNTLETESEENEQTFIRKSRR